MEVKFTEKGDGWIKFRVKGISIALANSLRRSMMMEIPVMAIEWVDFKKNDSILPDEVLANRLGLIPLHFSKKAYVLPEKCKCKGKGCSRCQVRLVLKKKGPCVVYSGDLKSEAKDVYPVFENIPIVELFEGEELSLEAIAQLGKGVQHAKWQASITSYEYDDGTFEFYVETVSGLTPKEIVKLGIESLLEKVKEARKLVESTK